MKTIPLFACIAALFSLLTSVCSAFDLGGLRVGNTPATQIAKRADIAGKGQYGKCLPFALDLNSKLRAAGFKSQVIGYRYQDLSAGGRNAGLSRGHAVVAYEDHGRTYVMDNQSWTPRWVASGPAGAVAGQFGGMEVQVQKAFVVNSASSPSRYNPSIGIDEASRRAMIAAKLHKKPAVAQASSRKNQA